MRNKVTKRGLQEQIDRLREELYRTDERIYVLASATGFYLSNGPTVSKTEPVLPPPVATQP
jgi:hypothetical protein